MNETSENIYLFNVISVKEPESFVKSSYLKKIKFFTILTSIELL